MQKHTISYDLPVDAIVHLAKRLNVYEAHHGFTSEEFFDKFNKGLMEDNKMLTFKIHY